MVFKFKLWKMKITRAGICPSAEKEITLGEIPRVIYFTRSGLKLNIQSF